MTFLKIEILKPSKKLRIFYLTWKSQILNILRKKGLIHLLNVQHMLMTSNIKVVNTKRHGTLLIFHISIKVVLYQTGQILHLMPIILQRQSMESKLGSTKNLALTRHTFTNRWLIIPIIWMTLNQQLWDFSSIMLETSINHFTVLLELTKITQKVISVEMMWISQRKIILRTYMQHGIQCSTSMKDMLTYHLLKRFGKIKEEMPLNLFIGIKSLMKRLQI